MRWITMSFQDSCLNCFHFTGSFKIQGVNGEIWIINNLSHDHWANYQIPINLIWLWVCRCLVNLMLLRLVRHLGFVLLFLSVHTSLFLTRGITDSLQPCESESSDQLSKSYFLLMDDRWLNVVNHNVEWRHGGSTMSKCGRYHSCNIFGQCRTAQCLESSIGSFLYQLR